MATKAEYQSVLDDMNVLEDQFDVSVALISSLEDGSEVYPHTSEIYTQIANIKSWSSVKINEIEKQEMMDSFLNSMRGLFIEYGAKLEILSASAENGYGMNYGMAEQDDGAIGFKLTIEKERLTVSKIYDKLSLQAEDF
jgi:hypothetical protein